MSPLVPTTLLTSSNDYVNQYNPEVDPFPNSIVVIGDVYDIREIGYKLNHGKMGMTHVYETELGSGQYFLVDRLGGDGIGGNGSSVVAESIEYGLLNTADDIVEGKSWHSWHVSDENYLVRANQAPIDELKEKVKECGCGPSAREVSKESSGDSFQSGEVRSYQIAIFMLPSSDLPTLGTKNEFTAKFPRKY